MSDPNANGSQRSTWKLDGDRPPRLGPARAWVVSVAAIEPRRFGKTWGKTLICFAVCLRLLEVAWRDARAPD